MFENNDFVEQVSALIDDVQSGRFHDEQLNPMSAMISRLDDELRRALVLRDQGEVYGSDVDCAIESADSWLKIMTKMNYEPSDWRDGLMGETAARTEELLRVTEADNIAV